VRFDSLRGAPLRGSRPGLHRYPAGTHDRRPPSTRGPPQHTPSPPQPRVHGRTLRWGTDSPPTSTARHTRAAPRVSPTAPGCRLGPSETAHLPRQALLWRGWKTR
jgi:hypothetical protein